ncbi:hypothetical protein [Streptomyces microflavus]|uniref:hypothetical protein n=1 Tax=Streptomyces microflavus TaxID=1919 RepID=UPI0036E8C38E
MAPRRLSGAELLARHEDAGRVYAEAFGGPPWSEDVSAADRFIRRLTDDVTRPGFTAAGTFRNDRLVGLATAWTTPAPFTGITVFLGPRHPARSAVTLPL